MGFTYDHPLITIKISFYPWYFALKKIINGTLKCDDIRTMVITQSKSRWNKKRDDHFNKSDYILISQSIYGWRGYLNISPPYIIWKSLQMFLTLFIFSHFSSFFRFFFFLINDRGSKRRQLSTLNIQLALQNPLHLNF